MIKITILRKQLYPNEITWFSLAFGHPYVQLHNRETNAKRVTLKYSNWLSKAKTWVKTVLGSAY